MPGSTTLGGGGSTTGWVPWAAGYSGASNYAAMPGPTAAAPVAVVSSQPTTAGLEPAAYEANPYGKIRPKFIAGTALMGGRLIEGPFFGGTGTDPTLTGIYYLAEAANPSGTRTIEELRIRGALAAFDGSGNLTDAKFAGATVEFKTGESPQTPCQQSIDRYGDNAIGYTRGILIAIKDLPLRPLAGIVPLISGKIVDTSFGAAEDDVLYSDMLEVILRDARYRDAEFEVDVQRAYPGMILANKSDVISFLQNERKIIVHMNIGFTDKVRIIEPTALTLAAEITNSNAVRDSLSFTKTDTTRDVRKIPYTYIDKDRDYEMNVVTAQDDVFPYPSTSSVQEEAVERPVISTASQETADVHVALYERLAVRSQMRAALLTSMFGAEVGDGSRYADHAVINFAGRIMETQHDYEKWQVETLSGEVLNCGAESIADYESIGFHEASGTNNHYTFGSCNIGDEDPDRVVVVVVTNTKSISPRRAVTAVTIGGNSAPIRVAIEEGDTVVSANPSMGIAIASLAVPTGTAAVIEIDTAGNVDGACIQVYALYSANVVPFHTASGTNPAGGNPSLSINNQSGAIVIAGYGAMGGTLGSASWVGLSTVDHNESFPGPSAWSSGANQGALGAQTGRTISASSSASGPEVIIAASFSPV